MTRPCKETEPSSRYHAMCEEYRLGLNRMSDGTDRRRIPLQDEDHSGHDPHLLPGFLCLCSGMFPKRFPTVSVPACSRENSSSLHKAPKIRDSVLLNSWENFLVTLPSAFNLLRNLGYVFLTDSRNARVP